MKKIIVFSFALFAGVVVFAQKVVPSSNVITEQRTVLDFSQLVVSNGIEVVVAFTGSEKIEIQAPDNVVQFIETVAEKGVLNVRVRKGVKFRVNPTVKVFINMKSLTRILATDNSKIVFENTISAEKLDITLNNATLKGHIAVQKASIVLTKGAKADLSGTCNELKLNSSGASTLVDTSLSVDVLEAKMNGQCTARVMVTQSLEFNGAKGSNLYYLGNPKIKGIKASGDSGFFRAD